MLLCWAGTQLDTAEGSWAVGTARGTHRQRATEGWPQEVMPLPQGWTSTRPRAEPPLAAQPALWLGAASSRCSLRHQPNSLAWGPAPDPGQDADASSHHSQSMDHRSGAGSGRRVRVMLARGDTPGRGGAALCSRQLSICSAAPGSLLLLACPPLQGHPPWRDYRGESSARS